VRPKMSPVWENDEVKRFGETTPVRLLICLKTCCELAVLRSCGSKESGDRPGRQMV
jgi:hypothetical protein